jgi:hypothetical protein
MNTPLDDDQIRDYEMTAVDAAALMIQGTRGYILATHVVPDLIAEVRRLHKERAAAEAKVERVAALLRDLDHPNPEADQDWHDDPVGCISDTLRAALSGDAAPRTDGTHDET